MIFLGTRIHVRAAVDEQFDEVEYGRAIDAFVDSVIQVHIADINGGPQRGSAPEVRSIYVGPMIEEKSRYVEVVIEDGHEQRTNFVRIGEFHISPSTDQRPCFFDAAVPRRVPYSG